MSQQVKEQVRDHFHRIDQRQEQVDWSRIQRHLGSDPEIVASPSSRTSTGRLAAGVAAAVVILFILGLTTWNQPASDDVLTPPSAPTPPSVATTVAEGARDLAPVVPGGLPLPRVLSSYRPFGEITVAQEAYEFEYIPVGANFERDWNVASSNLRPGVIEADGRVYSVGVPVTVGPNRLMSSDDGLSWGLIETSGLEGLSGTSSLFEAADRYWITSVDDSANVSLYVSSDLDTWLGIDLGGDLYPSPGFVVIGDSIAGFGPDGLVMLDSATNTAEWSDTPWRDEIVSGAMAVDGELRVFVPGDPGDGVIEYTTNDGTDWSASTPTLLGQAPTIYDAVTGAELGVRWISVAGNLETGFVARVIFDAFDNLGNDIALIVVSADGVNWQIAAHPHPSPEAPIATEVIPTKFGAGMALVSQRGNVGSGNSVLIAADGIEWQDYQLDPVPAPSILEPPGAGVASSMTVIDNRVLVYSNVQGWLNAWVIELGN